MNPEERRRRRDQRRRERRARRRERGANDRRERDRAAPPIDPEVVATIEEERLLRRQEIVLSRHPFDTDEEVDRFVATDEFEKELAAVEDDFNLEERAQEIMFRALLAATFEEAMSLSEKAVRLDPDCVDARLILAAGLTRDSEEYLDLLYRAVWAGERWLGEEYYDECKGRFWVIATTRPYMRALYQLGVTLMRMEEHDEAAQAFEQMIELNPDDDQGARLFLMALHLIRENLDRARELFESYSDDLTATGMWARSIERVLAGDELGAVERLDLARQWSPRVLTLLVEGKVFEEEPRDDDEFAAYLLMPVLDAHPAVREWFRQR